MVRFVGMLHVYGPPAWHEPAYLVGTSDALTALRNAIDRALAKGESRTASYTGDGQRCEVFVKVLDEQCMAQLALPYTSEYAQERNRAKVWPSTLFECDKIE